VVEHYQVVLLEAYREARQAMEQALRAMCAREVPGDTYRNLVTHASFAGETFKLALVPLWLLTYIHRGRPFQVVANGYTGRIAGRYPKSPWKILLLALGVLAAATLAAIWLRG
jgi:hypothetical protein